MAEYRGGERRRGKRIYRFAGGGGSSGGAAAAIKSRNACISTDCNLYKTNSSHSF